MLTILIFSSLECVIVEVAEYTINPTYFNEENLKNFSLNPKLDELSAEQQEDLSVISPDIEEGQTLATVSGPATAGDRVCLSLVRGYGV